MKVENNTGKLDRILRVLFGAGFIAAGYAYLSAPISYLVMLVGLVLIVTGITGFCAAYTVLGINTRQGICDLDFKGRK